MMGYMVRDVYIPTQFNKEEKLGGRSNPAINPVRHFHKLPRTNLLVCRNNLFLD